MLPKTTNHNNGSLVALVIRLPMSCIVSMTFSFHDPDVSIAIGAKMCVEVMSVHFRSAARFAAATAITEVSFRCESANVFRTVTSQASGLPCDHGMSVAPSGRVWNGYIPGQWFTL